MKQAQRILSVGGIGILCACFAFWVKSSVFVPGFGAAVGAAAAFLFGIGAVLFAHAFVAESAASPRVCPAPRRRFAVGQLVLWALAFRLATLAAGVALARLSGDGGTITELFLKGDAPHYMGLAENGYLNVGDTRFHLVFFPLYPLLTRLAALAPIGYPTAGMAVSILCFCAATPVMYELARCDLPEPDAFFAALAISAAPAAFFFSAPMSESLFLLCILCCALAARRGRLFLAGICGFFCALCRAPGVSALLLIGFAALPLFCSALRSCRRAALGVAVRAAGGMAMTLGGFLCYLGLNFAVSGNAFQFAVYQKEHWSQSFGWFFSTAAYQWQYLQRCFSEGDFSALAIWIPGLLGLFVGLLGLILAAKKLPAIFSGWALAYYAATMGATWLLSAPRYLAVLFVLPLGLAALRPKWLRGSILGLSLLAQIGYLWLYMAGYPVY